MKKLFERLSALRGDESVSAFARRVGLPQQTMDRYLHGRPPSLAIFASLATQLGVSADWLLGFTDERTGHAAPVTDAASAARIAELERSNAILRERVSALEFAIEAVGGRRTATSARSGGGARGVAS